MSYYKLARPDGWDWYTGETINYREGIGQRVKAPGRWDKQSGLCAPGILHASLNPNDCFVGAKIPCSAYEVEGRPVVSDDQKAGFRSLRVVREIEDLDGLFGWRYTEAANPINPFAVAVSGITPDQIALLKTWASMRDLVAISVYDSVYGSVRESVYGSVRDSVAASVAASVYDSVWDSVAAYIGSLFPVIEDWKYIQHIPKHYPFQAAADLWRMGLVPSFDGKLWRLHSGPDARVLWEGIS